MRRFSILLGTREKEEKLVKWLKKYDIPWNGGRNVEPQSIFDKKFYSIEFNLKSRGFITYSTRDLNLGIPKYTILDDSIKDKINNIPLITEEMFCEFMEIK